MSEIPEDREMTIAENVRLNYDFFKHLTTLNTAAILLYVTMIEKFLSATSFWADVAIFGLFGASLLSSLVSMGMLANGVGNMHPLKSGGSFLASVTGLAFGISQLGFIVGLIVMVVVALSGA